MKNNGFLCCDRQPGYINGSTKGLESMHPSVEAKETESGIIIRIKCSTEDGNLYVHGDGGKSR